MPQNTEPRTYRVGQVVTIDDQAYLSLPIHLGVVIEAPEDGRHWCQVAALKNDSRFGMQVRAHVFYSSQISPADFRPTIYESETYNSVREHAGYPVTGEFIRAIHRFLFAVYARRFLTTTERYRESTICNQIRVGDRYRIPLGSLTSGVYRVTEVCGGTAVGITPEPDEPACAEFPIDNEGTFYVSARSLSVRGSRITGWQADPPPRGIVFPPPPSQAAERQSEHRCDESCYDNGCEYNEETRPLSDVNPDDEDYYGDDDSMCDCSTCSPQRISVARDRDIPGYINEYSYKPKPIFFGKGSGLYLGSELEIETGSFMPECARTVSAHLGRRAYMKFDGSISSGFEIVTHPMTFAWVAEHFPARELFEELRLDLWTRLPDTPEKSTAARSSRIGRGNGPRSNPGSWRTINTKHSRAKSNAWESDHLSRGNPLHANGNGACHHVSSVPLSQQRPA